MVELFYFSNLDLMLKVEYAKEAGVLCCTSHREMEPNERLMAEQYLLTKMLAKTDDDLEPPVKFVYLGTDKRLRKRLAGLRQKEELQLSRRNEKEIAASVKNLINVSMRNYYTERIGELIMSARLVLQDGEQHQAQASMLKQQMNDLLKAYNFFTDRKVTLNEIIPADLKPYWPGLEKVRRYMLVSQ